jgi:acid phosphatase type 7
MELTRPKAGGQDVPGAPHSPPFLLGHQGLRILGLGMKFYLLLFLGLVVAGPGGAGARERGGEFNLTGLFLTWQGDPTSTMTIDWHTADGAMPPALEYRQAGMEVWQIQTGQRFPFPFSKRTVHRVELAALQPGATYQFRFSPGTPVYSFRTMPRQATRPIRFVAGGDVRHRQEWMEAANRLAARMDPDFIVWGGDLAYADGREDRAGNWHEFFDAIRNSLVTPEGRVIPVLAAIGNHEVRGGFHFNMEGYVQDAATRAALAPYYFTLFAMPGQPGYNVLDFGDYLSIFLLDSNHTNPVAGTQTEWLAQALATRQEVPHLFPVYHVTAYPSHRSFEDRTSREIRQHWVPLFERFNVRVAFENHDHTYKRTVPIRANQPHPQGIVYIGDGCWGVSPRSVHDPAATWYLEKALSTRHVILVTVDRTHQHFLVVDEQGKVIDEYPATPQWAFEPLEATPESAEASP